MKPCLRLLCLAISALMTVRAGETALNISQQMNSPWGNGFIDNGDTLPTGSQNFGGVPFFIPDGVNNYWSGNTAANNGAGTVTVTIPVGIYGIRSLFTLISTAWGQPGPDSYLSVVFTGSSGETVTAQLVGDVNVRNISDFPGYNTNRVNNTTTVQVFYNGLKQHLDRQEYVLPVTFATQILENVTIVDTGNYVFSRGIFSGLTVSTCHGYVEPFLTMTSGPITYSPDSEIYEQDVTLTNNSEQTVEGPLFLLAEELPPGVRVLQSEPSVCYQPIGSPYVRALAAGSSIAPAAAVIVHLRFRDPGGDAITYTPMLINNATP